MDGRAFVHIVETPGQIANTAERKQLKRSEELRTLTEC